MNATRRLLLLSCKPPLLKYNNGYKLINPYNNIISTRYYSSFRAEDNNKNNHNNYNNRNNNNRNNNKYNYSYNKRSWRDLFKIWIHANPVYVQYAYKRNLVPGGELEFVILIGISLILFNYVYDYSKEAPERHFRMLDRKYKERVKEATANGKIISNDSEMGKTISRLFYHLKKRTNIFHTSAYSWKLAIIDDIELVLHIDSSGTIVVSSGLFSIIKKDEELAVLLAHQIGLFNIRITYELKTERKVLNYFDSQIDKRERELDEFSVRLLQDSGFNPSVAPDVWSQINQINKDHSFTHKRSQALKDVVEQFQLQPKLASTP